MRLEAENCVGVIWPKLSSKTRWRWDDELITSMRWWRSWTGDVYTQRPVAHLETASTPHPHPSPPPWPSRPAHSALFTGPCNALIHRPGEFLSWAGKSSQKTPWTAEEPELQLQTYFEQKICFLSKFNIFLPEASLIQVHTWKDPWLELCGNLVSAAPVKTSPKPAYVIINTMISNV